MLTYVYLAAGCIALVVVGCIVYCGVLATRDDYELVNDWREP